MFILPGIESFSEWAIHGLFLFFTNWIKTVDFTEIQTRIVGVEAEHADH